MMKFDDIESTNYVIEAAVKTFLRSYRGNLMLTVRILLDVDRTIMLKVHMSVCKGAEVAHFQPLLAPSVILSYAFSMFFML